MTTHTDVLNAGIPLEAIVLDALRTDWGMLVLPHEAEDMLHEEWAKLYQMFSHGKIVAAITSLVKEGFVEKELQTVNSTFPPISGKRMMYRLTPAGEMAQSLQPPLQMVR